MYFSSFALLKLWGFGIRFAVNKNDDGGGDSWKRIEGGEKEGGKVGR